MKTLILIICSLMSVQFHILSMKKLPNKNDMGEKSDIFCAVMLCIYLKKMSH